MCPHRITIELEKEKKKNTSSVTIYKNLLEEEKLSLNISTLSKLLDAFIVIFQMENANTC